MKCGVPGAPVNFVVFIVIVSSWSWIDDILESATVLYGTDMAAVGEV
jgi:hypothetical protein